MTKHYNNLKLICHCIGSKETRISKEIRLQQYANELMTTIIVLFFGLYFNYCIVCVLQFLFFVLFILQLLFFVAFILQLLFFVIFILQLLFFVYTICCNHCTMRCNHCTTRCISFFWLFFCQNTITAVTIQYNKCFSSFFF